MAEQGTKIDVAQVASLARLSLPQDMIPRLQAEMEQIVGYVEMLAELDVSGIEPTAHAVARTNVLRDDEPSDPFPREAMLAPFETLPREQALGRVLAAPTVSCPPAVPILVCGERIDAQALALFAYYGLDRLDVVLPDDEQGGISR